MNQRNILLRLQKLREKRLNQLKEFIENDRNLIINSLYIDSLIISCNNQDNRMIISEEDKEIIKGINEKIKKEYISLSPRELKYIYELVSTYKYSEEDNQKALNNLILNIDKIFYKDIYSDKYNISKTHSISNEEYDMARRQAINEIKNKNIDEQYICETLDNFEDALRLYRDRYFDHHVIIESNNLFDNKRIWYVHFERSCMPHIMGLPNKNDLFKTNFYGALSSTVNFECEYVVDYFMELSKHYRAEIVNHEKKMRKKFNWGRINVKTMAFKNFGDFSYGTITMYKKRTNNSGYFIEKEAINKNIKDFVELELVTGKESRREFLVPRSIRFSKSDRNDNEERIYLGLASNIYSYNLKSILDSIKNDDNDFFEYYLSTNQEKFLESAEMICSRSKVTDRIILSETDLDYMFLSNDYANDHRLIADFKTKQIINDFYNNLQKEPVGITTFKQIYKLSKKVKLSEKDNLKIKKRIKEKLYLEGIYTMENARKYNEDFFAEHDDYIKQLRKKYNK